MADVPLQAEIPLVTLFLAAALYLPAVLRPHQRRDQLARLRVGAGHPRRDRLPDLPALAVAVRRGAANGAARRSPR